MAKIHELQSIKEKHIIHLSHDDLDGYGALVLTNALFTEAFIATREYDIYLNGKECYPCSYHDFDTKLGHILTSLEGYNTSKLEKYALIITDISTKDENLLNRVESLYDNGLTVIWLDHHVTAKDYLDKYPFAYVSDTHEDLGIVLTQLEGKSSGTSLYLQYLSENMGYSPSWLSTIQFVYLVTQWDTFEWQETNNIKAKHVSNLLYTITKEEFMELMVQTLNKKEFVLPSIYSFLFEQNDKREEDYIKQRLDATKKTMLRVDNKEYKVAYIIASQFHSTLGSRIAKEYKDCDFVVIFDYEKKKVSLRRSKTSTVHLGEIAKYYGGGGHPAAAGFELYEDVAENEIRGLM